MSTKRTRARGSPKPEPRSRSFPETRQVTSKQQLLPQPRETWDYSSRTDQEHSSCSVLCQAAALGPITQAAVVRGFSWACETSWIGDGHSPEGPSSAGFGCGWRRRADISPRVHGRFRSGHFVSRGFVRPINGLSFLFLNRIERPDVVGYDQSGLLGISRPDQ